MIQEARSGQAFARVDDAAGPCQIGNADIELRLRAAADGALVISSLRQDTTEWASPGSDLLACPLPGRPNASFRLVAGEVATEADDVIALRLRGYLGDTRLHAEITLRAYPGTSALTLQAAIQNEGDAPSTIVDPPSLELSLAPPLGATLATLRGGAYHEGLPPNGYTVNLANLDGVGHARARTWGTGSDGRSSTEFVPWYALLGQGGGIVAALEWSGRWRLELQWKDNRPTLRFGLSDFQHELGPGQRIEIPPVVLSAFAGGLDEAGARLHEWEERFLCPAVPDDWPWVQYNHWYAYHGDIDAERLLQEADLAAEAGCEVFVIDDGWFVGRRPDSYTEGWGNWNEDRAKFPDGLRAFGDRLRERGLRFGLWVEPERADGYGAVAREHPDWLAQRDGAVISRRWGEGLGAHLCLGVPAVQEWMAREIIRVVQDYRVDWLKWDYNIGYGLGCNRPDHGHQAGDGHYAYTLGLYRVLARIRAACPDLVIENCASGGNRVDLGILRYTHTEWLSDYTHRAASCRHHAQGAWFALPAYFLNTWVLEQRDLAELRSRMGGAFGVSAHLGSWSAAERETLATGIREFKQLRPLIRSRRYLLGSLWHSSWDVWQFHDPASDRAAVLAFRAGSTISTVQVQPRALAADRSYHVIDSDSGGVRQLTGAQLSQEGIPITLSEPHRSALLWIEPTE